MFAARIPVANMASANATLAAAGFGPRNFSVPVFTTGPGPTHATLHAWGSNLGPFYDAVKALPGVVWSEAAGEPQARVQATLTAIQGRWAATALPLTGTVQPGLHRHTDGTLWTVIQSYNTATWPNPAAPGLLALVRRARVPGEVAPWVQPIDGFDAYKLVNQFTGEPDRATFNGQTWRVTQADGAGNNVWQPGVFGWTVTP